MWVPVHFQFALHFKRREIDLSCRFRRFFLGLWSLFCVFHCTKSRRNTRLSTRRRKEMAAAKRMRTEEVETELDFSRPWKMSDVVLVVEDQKLHVHRNVLALWSPVFEKMFTSNFKEKSKGEIRLPGKQAESVKALLSMIYPPANDEITLGNYNAILELAHEYQISSIVEKCEEFLVDTLFSSPAHKIDEEEDLLSLLILAQNYKLERVRDACVLCAGKLTLTELKEHELCDQIEPENYAEILEAIIKRMQRFQNSMPSKETLRGIKAKGIRKIDAIVKLMLKHSSHKNFVASRDVLGTHEDAIEAYLLALKMDNSSHSCPNMYNTICPGLSVFAPLLKQLKGTLESIIEG